jgi:hypothetical protein
LDRYWIHRGPVIKPDALTDTVFWRQYAQQEEQTIIETSSLKARDEITKRFANGQMTDLFSIPALEALFGIKNDLVKKHQNQEISLEELLRS